MNTQEFFDEVSFLKIYVFRVDVLFSLNDKIISHVAKLIFLNFSNYDSKKVM